MRASKRDGKDRPVFVSTLARLISPALAIGFGLYMGSKEPAYSQIESHNVSAPAAAATSSHPSATTSEKPAMPKAPVQVEMPVQPPTKIFPGLEEPLVATGPVTEEEGKDLDIALKSFHEAPAKAGPGGDFDDYAKPLIAFITLHPQSNWNAAIYTNLGFGYYRAGYYSRTYPALEKAWELGRNAPSFQAHLMVDRAVGELAKMHARVGHATELEALLKDIGKRPIGGPATELIQGAREGLWSFHHDPGEAYLCGPAALRSVLLELKFDEKKLKAIADAKSGEHGFSLAELAKLADKAKLKYTLIHREAGQPIPVPSVINWNVHHYAAVTENFDGLYKVLDPTFGSISGIMLTPKAIDAEGSGYFLVPSKVLAENPKAGWRVIAVNSAEAKSVYGMGNVSSSLAGENMPVSPTQCNCSVQSSPAPNDGPPSYDDNSTNFTLNYGMPTTNVNTMLVSLKLSDTPVGYKPQKGLPGFATLTYNQREAEQPATFGYGNVGQKWTLNWLASMRDTPTNGYSLPITLTPGGGGGSDYNNYNAYIGVYTLEPWNNIVNTRVPISGSVPYYKRYLPDGGTEIYSLSDGATTAPRRIFLTSRTDAQGNTTTLNYDSSLRLTSVVDSMGRSMTFTYGLTGYPLLITKVTDPFGRYTQFTYDTSGRLSTVTDAIGITSSFTYSTTDLTFITQMTTPYGTTTYNETPNPNDTVETNTRALTMTDPLGYTDYHYFYQNPSIVTATDPTAIVPTGMVTNGNGLLQWRNTFYWDKHAFAQGVTMTGGQVTAQDFTKASITHWVHYAYYIYWAGPVPESVKPALEHRIWFNYPQQSSGYVGGLLNTVSAKGRVLDDGTTQLSKATFSTNNANNMLTNQMLSSTDPLGRTKQYNYAANNIDLLTVQQLTSIQNANLHTQVSYTYDSADRVLTKTDSEGYVLTYGYDNLDRVTSITYPDGTTDLYDYTFQSGPNVGTQSLEMRKHTDRLGRVTTYGYDADQRLTSVTEPTQGTSTRTTQYQYYENGTLKDIIDANGNDTHWAIDIESRPTSKTYAYGTSSAQTETYTYENTTSRLKSITDALGQVKTFTYGLDNRVTGITYTSSVNPTPNVTFAYDTYFPRKTSMTDGTGTTTYSYTPIGTNGALKLSSIAGPYTNSTIGLTYDTLGRLSGRNITGGNETFGYDPISRLTSHGTPLGSFTEAYLGQTDQQTSQSVTNGTVTVSTGWGYDTNTNDRRLISITNSGVSRSYTLGYGTSPVNVYDLMSITDTAAAGHPWATQSRNYTYDLIDRLLSASSTTPGNDTYAYDPLDNATTVTTPSGTVTPAPAYNGFNQLHTWASNTYAYDNNGNTLSGDGTRTYKWDAENRLAEIDYVGSTAKSQFSYDGINHQIVDLETASGGGTTTTHYLWCEDSICQTRDGSDNVLRRDLPEGELNLSSSQKLIYLPDQLGSTRDVIDATSGTRVASYDYTPYGAVARSSVTNGTDYQYAKLFYHSASGLNFAPYRAMDGVTGRWINRDPMREIVGNNLYSYGPNPVNKIDPLGLDAVSLLNSSGILQPSQIAVAPGESLTNQSDNSETNPAANPPNAGSSPTMSFPPSTSSSTTNSCHSNQHQVASNSLNLCWYRNTFTIGGDKICSYQCPDNSFKTKQLHSPYAACPRVMNESDFD